MQVRVVVAGAGTMGMNHLRVLKDFDEERIRLIGVKGNPTIREELS
jgi:homoserine dehydrogenase